MKLLIVGTDGDILDLRSQGYSCHQDYIRANYRSVSALYDTGRMRVSEHEKGLGFSIGKPLSSKQKDIIRNLMRVHQIASLEFIKADRAVLGVALHAETLESDLDKFNLKIASHREGNRNEKF